MIFNNEQFDYTTLKMNINKKRKSLDSSFMENTNVKKFKNDDNSSDSNNNNCSIINVSEQLCFISRFLLYLSISTIFRIIL